MCLVSFYRNDHSQFFSQAKSLKLEMFCSVLRPSISRILSLTGVRHKHTLPQLPYGYSALEPVVSGEIMELHHSKHHATYVNNLNAAEETLGQHVEQGTLVRRCQTIKELQK